MPEHNHIGVDIGTSSIKIVALKRKGKSATLLNAGFIEIEEKGTALNAMKILVERLRIRGKEVITKIPGSATTIRHVFMPRMSEKELKEAIRWEAKKHISYPLENAVVDYISTDGEAGGDKINVMLVAAEKSAVMSVYSIVRDAGLKVVAVDTNPLAILETLRLNYDWGSEENIVVVDIGAGTVEIDIIKGTQLRFTRSVDINGDDISKAMMEELGITKEEAEEFKKMGVSLKEEVTEGPEAIIRRFLDRLALEIQRSVDYYKAQSREKIVKRLILTGGIALMPGLKEYLAGIFDIVEIIEPFRSITYKEERLADIIKDAPLFTGVIGLAARKVI